MAPDLAAALEDWVRVVGRAHVVADGESLRAAEVATYPTRGRVLARVRPGSSREVADCLGVATARRVPVYPVSRGKNWGFGSRAPASRAAVLLELDRMAAISGLDEDLAHVTIEPGVTQRQLQDFLELEAGGRLWMDPTSSSLHASVLGNLMERGHGVGPYGDRVATACNYEVALPTGELIRTGYGGFANARSQHLDAWGIGPSLDGLFTQSSFGVVTRATLWLMPRPDAVEICLFSLRDDDDLERVIDRVRPLRLQRVLRSGPFLGNVYQSLQKVTSYPWAATAGARPLAPELARELARRYRYDRWNGSLALYGTAASVVEQKACLNAVLESCGATGDFVTAGLAGLERFPAERHREVHSVVSGFTGRPAGTSLPQAYWRKPTRPDPDDIDLDRDRCGFKFSSVSIPFRGGEVRRAVEVAARVVLAHGFEPAIGMLPIRERVVHCQVATAYDRDDRADDERVGPCHQAVLDALADMGVYPARLGVESMHVLARRDPEVSAVLHRLQRCFDPSGILAPGRYPAGGEVAGPGAEP